MVGMEAGRVRCLAGACGGGQSQCGLPSSWRLALTAAAVCCALHPAARLLQLLPRRRFANALSLVPDCLRASL